MRGFESRRRRMDRREFFRRSALAAAGVVAADQLDLVEKLAGMFRPKRKFFAGHRFVTSSYSLGFRVSQEMIDDDFVGGMAREMRLYRNGLREMHAKQILEQYFAPRA